MNYEQQILRILMEAGPQGLSVKKIARHVFNENNGFFCEVDYDTVHQLVRQYLQRQCAQRNGMVRRVSHGVYQLNTKTEEATQLLLQFKEADEDDSATPQAEDQSLSLF